MHTLHRLASKDQNNCVKNDHELELMTVKGSLNNSKKGILSRLNTNYRDVVYPLFREYHS